LPPLITTVSLKKMTTTFPTFDIATQRLKSFLNDQGWPTMVVWVEQSSVKPTSKSSAVLLPSDAYDEDNAKRDYDKAVHNGLGVAFEGLATTENQSYVAVTWPNNAEESECLMYCDHDLKLSLRVPRPSLV